MSLPEVMLWQRLRRRAEGIKVRRQHPLGPYALDFYCPAAKLAIEIDGAAHGFGNRSRRDVERETFIVGAGLHIIRLSAADVLHDPDAATDAIIRAALPLHHAAHGPPPHAVHGEDLVGAA